MRCGTRRPPLASSPARSRRRRLAMGGDAHRREILTRSTPFAMAASPTASRGCSSASGFPERASPRRSPGWSARLSRTCCSGRRASRRRCRRRSVPGSTARSARLWSRSRWRAVVALAAVVRRPRSPPGRPAPFLTSRWADWSFSAAAHISRLAIGPARPDLQRYQGPAGGALLCRRRGTPDRTDRRAAG